MIGRRGFLAVAGGAALLAATRVGAADKGFSGAKGLRDGMAALERRSGGRLGVSVHDTGSGRRFGWRADEMFPMCSTFKFLLAAAILRRVDEGRESLDRRIPVTPADMVPYAPFTETRLNGPAPTVAELCESTMTLSDNVAANLLLPAVGDPAGLTAFVRTLGDRHTRLDRNEPTLNSAIPGDPRDTTTPDAIIHSMERLMIGDALRPASREQLIHWMVANKTGDKRLRAGLTPGWRVGDKTGTGNGSFNDIAIVWPTGKPPVLIACYLAQTPKGFKDGDTIHAEVARAVAGALNG
ncbi:class A beta-lactamase [Azospirillum sp. SYSU D00513]|uniref:class A beta-lactamase n=1 Tax=Azospirillum sp. SYSU D00513 TaxID=2812561 RepID=UPI001A963A0A|nr:class A beta-lactamase [Azospirillum sp. SYSU D00513]